jgi:hypothetical protein
MTRICILNIARYRRTLPKDLNVDWGNLEEVFTYSRLHSPTLWLYRVLQWPLNLHEVGIQMNNKYKVLEYKEVKLWTAVTAGGLPMWRELDGTTPRSVVAFAHGITIPTEHTVLDYMKEHVTINVWTELQNHFTNDARNNHGPQAHQGGFRIT